jgi:4-aminobutyrate aminotransferase
MLSAERILELSDEGLLADVVGFETDEVARSAEGAVIETYCGASYIDFTGGIAVHACGHSHREIVNAICNQAAQLTHVSDVMRHGPQLELGDFLGRLLSGIVPGEPWTFLFKNSGSESIDAAAKLALKATGRSRFVALSGAFHGRTLFATALSRSKQAHWEACEPLITLLRPNIHHLPAPTRDSGSDAEPLVPALERLIGQHGEEIAALFFEAQQGEGGYVPMRPETALRLRELTARHGILLIADEIQSGFGRTGRWFGFQHLGIAPDIVVFGKSVGGGLPLAGMAAQRSLMSRWEPGEHGTTFGGNPVACAAGLAALRIIEREGLVERAFLVGNGVKARLRTLVGRHGVVDVRGNGLMIGIELRDAAGKPDYARVTAIKRRAQARGLLVLSCGAHIGDPQVDNATIRLIPPLNIEESVLNAGLAILEDVLKAAESRAA